MTKSIWKPEKAEVNENVALSPKKVIRLFYELLFPNPQGTVNFQPI